MTTRPSAARWENSVLQLALRFLLCCLVGFLATYIILRAKGLIP